LQIETLRDVLHWTRKFHQRLYHCFQHCVDEDENERARLLLAYLAEHENKLIRVLDGFEKTASSRALNTWCYEYVDRHPILRHKNCDSPFENMSTSEITAEVAHLHQEVINLYRYLNDRAESLSAQDLLKSLKEVEENESMLMVKNAINLEDI